jgi:hypothetical protein
MMNFYLIKLIMNKIKIIKIIYKSKKIKLLIDFNIIYFFDNKKTKKIKFYGKNYIDLKLKKIILKKIKIS